MFCGTFVREEQQIFGYKGCVRQPGMSFWVFSDCAVTVEFWLVIERWLLLRVTG